MVYGYRNSEIYSMSLYISRVYSPKVKCEASVPRSIHSSRELKRCIMLAEQHVQVNVMGGVLYHMSHDLAYVGRHDLRIKALNKGNTYSPSMRSVSYLSCR